MGKLDELKGDLDFIKSLQNWTFGFIFALTNGTTWIFLNNPDSHYIIAGILIDSILFILLIVLSVIYFDINRQIGVTKNDD
ncbi:MAG: hypothetical protein IPQ05_22720 [Leptospiraceae bacterium]|nr:hypothetical protein [Leptospiraceae bacterium]MBK9503437.1 hypothetical protein [Leptospiraceae bacterium]MBL0266593.1 hypothetical protein [Leptospiraceae bacterium]MBP6738337.1 hypothetical protein [Leptospiraceae bacterium]